MIDGFSTDKIIIKSLNDDNNINKILLDIKDIPNFESSAMFVLLNDENVESFIEKIDNDIRRMSIYVVNTYDSVIIKQAVKWNGIHIVSSYIKDIYTPQNIQYMTLLNYKVGNAIKVINPFSVNVYEVLQLFREVGSFSTVPSVNNLLLKFYSVTVTSLQGTSKLQYNNYMDKPVYVSIFY